MTTESPEVPNLFKVGDRVIVTRDLEAQDGLKFKQQHVYEITEKNKDFFNKNNKHCHKQTNVY
jgi:hypothetical protein